MKKVYPLSSYYIKLYLSFGFWILFHLNFLWSFQEVDSLVKIRTIKGNISPRSIHNSGLGEFVISSPRFQHSISIFNNKFEEISFFNDSLLNQSIQDGNGIEKQIPLAVSFSHFGKYAWISSYPSLSTSSLIPNSANCENIYNNPPGYIFKVNTQSSRVESFIQTGKYPVNLLVTPDHRYLIAANSCSKELHIIDTQSNTLIKEIPLGKYPLGLSTESQSRYLFVTLTESSQMAIIDLETFAVNQISLGKNENPMFVQVSPNGKYVYVSLAGSGSIGKYYFDKDTLRREKKVFSGRSPRSMELTPDGAYLYVANYLSHTVTKIRTADMKITHTTPTPHNPIDLSFDPESSQLWVVSNQQRNITVYLDKGFISSQPYKKPMEPEGKLPHTLKTITSRSIDQENPVSTFYQTSLRQTASRDTLIHLILGSFSERENAENYLQSLSTQGIEAFLLPKEEGVIRIGMGTFRSDERCQNSSIPVKRE